MAVTTEFEITPGGLYVPTWDYLYLFQTDEPPVGLPNKLFSDQPWALILFEHIYCDQNGLEGERNAYKYYKWTNSWLFTELAEEKNGSIIKPLSDMKERLAPHIESIREAFQAKSGKSIEEAALTVDHRQLEDYFGVWRLSLLSHFLDETGLTFYDWPITRSGARPHTGIELSDFLFLEPPNVPLSRFNRQEWDKQVSDAYDRTQNLERKYLPDLRLGKMSHKDYLERLKDNFRDYKIVDQELRKGLQENLDRILRARNRYREAEGWALTQEYLQLRVHSQDKKLPGMEAAIQRLLDQCLADEKADYGVVKASIASGHISQEEVGVPVSSTVGETDFSRQRQLEEEPPELNILKEKEKVERQPHSHSSHSAGSQGGLNRVRREDTVKEFKTVSSKHQDQHDSLIPTKSEERTLGEIIADLDLHEFNEPPFSGKPIAEIEAECGVKLKILEKDNQIDAYRFRVTGPSKAVVLFLKKYPIDERCL